MGFLVAACWVLVCLAAAPPHRSAPFWPMDSAGPFEIFTFFKLNVAVFADYYPRIKSTPLFRFVKLVINCDDIFLQFFIHYDIFNCFLFKLVNSLLEQLRSFCQIFHVFTLSLCQLFPFRLIFLGLNTEKGNSFESFTQPIGHFESLNFIFLHVLFLFSKFPWAIAFQVFFSVFS